MSPVVDRQQAIEAEGLPGQAELEAWVAAVLARHEVAAESELTVRLVDAEESRTLNRDYRGRDRPTNVLSFPFESPPGMDLPLLGDLVICHPVVVAEAAEQDKALADHYAHMVVHGTLDRKSTRLNSSHVRISYAVFCLKKKTKKNKHNN